MKDDNALFTPEPDFENDTPPDWLRDMPQVHLSPRPGFQHDLENRLMAHAVERNTKKMQANGHLKLHADELVQREYSSPGDPTRRRLPLTLIAAALLIMMMAGAFIFLRGPSPESPTHTFGAAGQDPDGGTQPLAQVTVVTATAVPSRSGELMMPTVVLYEPVGLLWARCVTCRLQDAPIVEIGFAMEKPELPGFINTLKEGDNEGTLEAGSQFWVYSSAGDETLTLHARAAHPARVAGDGEFDGQGLDTVLLVYNPSGQLIIAVDDTNGASNAKIEGLPLIQPGAYLIEVRNWAKGLGDSADYTLVAETEAVDLEFLRQQMTTYRTYPLGYEGTVAPINTMPFITPSVTPLP